MVGNENENLEAKTKIQEQQQELEVSLQDELQLGIKKISWFSEPLFTNLLTSRLTQEL